MVDTSRQLWFDYDTGKHYIISAQNRKVQECFRTGEPIKKFFPSVTGASSYDERRTLARSESNKDIMPAAPSSLSFKQSVYAPQTDRFAGYSQYRAPLNTLEKNKKCAQEFLSTHDKILSNRNQNILKLTDYVTVSHLTGTLNNFHTNGSVNKKVVVDQLHNVLAKHKQAVESSMKIKESGKKEEKEINILSESAKRKTIRALKMMNENESGIVNRGKSLHKPFMSMSFKTKGRNASIGEETWNARSSTSRGMTENFQELTKQKTTSIPNYSIKSKHTTLFQPLNYQTMRNYIYHDDVNTSLDSSSNRMPSMQDISEGYDTVKNMNYFETKLQNEEHNRAGFKAAPEKEKKGITKGRFMATTKTPAQLAVIDKEWMQKANPEMHKEELRKWDLDRKILEKRRMQRVLKNKAMDLEF